MSIWSYFIKGPGGKGTTSVARQNAGQENRADISFRLADKILKGQLAVANYLNTKTRNIPKAKMKLLLISFITVGGVYCLYLVIEAVLLFLN